MTKLCAKELCVRGILCDKVVSVCDKVVCDKVVGDKVACGKDVCEKVVCERVVFDKVVSDKGARLPRQTKVDVAKRHACHVMHKAAVSDQDRMAFLREC